jgi:uncharacterized protein (DUF1697 family)
MLRGVNVGGHNKIKMEALRALYESLKLLDAQTYVQSGNVIFKSEEKDLGLVAKRIQSGIERSFDCHPDIILRTASELRNVIARNPFVARRNIDPSKLLVTFLTGDPGEQAREMALGIKTDPQELRIHGREAYVYFPNGMARPKMRWPPHRENSEDIRNGPKLEHRHKAARNCSETGSLRMITGTNAHRFAAKPNPSMAPVSPFKDCGPDCNPHSSQFLRAGARPQENFEIDSAQNPGRRLFLKHKLSLVLLACVMLFAAQSSSAHHSPSSIVDMTNKSTLSGTLTQVEWINPHIAVYIDAKKDDGTVENWKFESAPPSWLRRMGVGKSDFSKPIWQIVTVEGNRARSGALYGFLQKITFSDGNSLEIVSPSHLNTR